jgi:hypothetical protein
VLTKRQLSKILPSVSACVMLSGACSQILHWSKQAAAACNCIVQDALPIGLHNCACIPFAKGWQACDIFRFSIFAGNFGTVFCDQAYWVSIPFILFIKMSCLHRYGVCSGASLLPVSSQFADLWQSSVCHSSHPSQKTSLAITQSLGIVALGISIVLLACVQRNTAGASIHAFAQRY